jgi:glycosyltransferase involved in cell wall biosynthesis
MILDLHNIESIWHERLADAGRGPVSWLHRRFARAYRRMEREYFSLFDVLLVTSSADAAAIRDRVCNGRIEVYPNALPPTARPVRAEADAILFTGNLEYEPNLSAIRYFRDCIWPDLQSRWPGLTWQIAGKHPEAVRKLVERDSRIQLMGPMRDAIATLAAAKVAVVPLLAGSGTRIKILEAWAAATPVVSTRLGAEGLGCQDGEHLLLAETPEAFVRAVTSLLNSREERVRIGNAGRSFFEQHFTWPVAWKMLGAVLNDSSQV